MQIIINADQTTPLADLGLHCLSENLGSLRYMKPWLLLTEHHKISQIFGDSDHLLCIWNSDESLITAVINESSISTSQALLTSLTVQEVLYDKALSYHALLIS